MNATGIVQVPVRPARRIRPVIGVIFLALIGLWLAVDVVQTSIYALANFGPLALLMDGVLHFRVGAALVILPLSGYLLYFSGEVSASGSNRYSGLSEKFLTLRQAARSV